MNEHHKKEAGIMELIAIIMYVAGAYFIFIGLPLTLLFGLGLLFIGYGCCMIYFGTLIHARKRRAYTGAIVLGAIALVYTFLVGHTLSALAPALFLYALYAHRDELVNE